MSSCSVCGQGRPADNYGRCSRCSAAIYGGDGRGTPAGKVGTTFGSERAWLEERARGVEDRPKVKRIGSEVDA